VESLSRKRAFRQAFSKSESCLISADAYYEWQGEKDHKTMYSVRLKEPSPLFMAYWQSEMIRRGGEGLRNDKKEATTEKNNNIIAKERCDRDNLQQATTV